MCILFIFFVQMSTLHLHKIQSKKSYSFRYIHKKRVFIRTIPAMPLETGGKIYAGANILAPVGRRTPRADAPFFARMPKNV